MRGYLSKYPVDCPKMKEAFTQEHFLSNCTTTAAIIISGIPVPWLQVHQHARALRYSSEHGLPVLNRFQPGRFRRHQRTIWTEDSMARLADDNMLFRDGRFRPITDRHHFASIRSGAKDAKFICSHARVSLEFRRKLNRILLTACKMFCKDMQTEPHGILYLRDRCE